MKRKEAVANQLMLPDMPRPTFDRRGYSDSELVRAAQNVAECYELLARIPELLEVAYCIVLERVAQAGHVGTRWLGEQVRAWLADTHDSMGFTNGIIAVMVRLLIREHHWVAGFVSIKPCAIDAVLAAVGDAS